MKKKFIYVMIFIMILGIILISSPIGIIKRIKEFTKKIEPISSNENNITKIDITNFESNINVEHEHIYKTMYDNENHWEECTICAYKNNKNTHNYKDSGWTMGSQDYCNNDNLHVFICECGSKISNSIGRAEHQANGYANDPTYYMQYNLCRNCDFALDLHYCKIGKRRIDCNNLGKCSICGYNYTYVSHAFSNLDDNGNVTDTISCENCKFQFRKSF